MLSTTHSTIAPGGPAELFANLWRSDELLIPWSWAGKSVFLIRDPEAVLEAIRNPALERTWQAEIIIGPGVLASPGAAWKEGRGAAKALFTDDLVSAFCDAALHSLEARSGALASDAPTELFEHLSRIALGAFTRYAFGSLPNDAEWRVLREVQRVAIHDVGKLSFPRGTQASELLRLQQSCKGCAAQTDRVIESLLERCLQTQGTPPDFVRHLRGAEESGALTNSTAASQMRNVLIASFLTTGILLTNAVREALLLDGFWESLRDEAEGASPLDSPRSAEDLKRPLAAAAIDEAARLYPPVWVIGREAHQDTELAGRPLLAGTTVQTVMLFHHRDKEFWEDPLRWNPERYLSENGHTTSAGNLAFLTGRHICLGKSFARAEATLLLSELARRFTIRLVDGATPLQYIDGLVLAPNEPIMAHMVPR